MDKLPHCKLGVSTLQHYVSNRLKYCNVLGGLQVFPECDQKTDAALSKLSKETNLKDVCGATIAKQFTVHGVSSINACGSQKCMIALFELSSQLPICKHKFKFLQDHVVAALSKCVGECSDHEYEWVEYIADDPIVSEYCGNATVSALKAHSIEDIDVCASPECNALMFFYKQENTFPMCFEKGELLLEPLTDMLIKC
ncbi:hypothetical protein ATCC90586_006392 [Pythium insidiosum]|nr:hypothetical protein ATCC90586_006392 [Pythium insidiosum]